MAANTRLDVLFPAAVCQAEILSGIANPAKGPPAEAAWKSQLWRRFARILLACILPFDTERRCLSTRQISRTAGSAGRRRRRADLMIALDRRVREMPIVVTLATSPDVRGLRPSNPWHQSVGATNSMTSGAAFESGRVDRAVPSRSEAAH